MVITRMLLALVQDEEVQVDKTKAKKGKKDKVEKEEEVVNYGPKDLKAGDKNFGVAHIYASFNDTFVVGFRRVPLM